MRASDKYWVLALLLVAISGQLLGLEVFIEHHAAGTSFVTMIPYKSLMFEKARGLAEYQISMVIRNSEKKQVASFEKRLEISEDEALNGTALVIRNEVSLAAGNYIADIIIRNAKLGDKRNMSSVFEIGIKSEDIGRAFVLGDKKGVTYALASTVGIDQLFERVYLFQTLSIPLDSLAIEIGGKSLVFANPSKSNEYDLSFARGILGSTEAKIHYYEANIRYLAEPFWFGAWQGYGSKYSLKDQIAQLRYIATQNEWNSLKRLASNMQGDAIERFWQKHDPSPGTARNEAREEFNKRVIIADERFTIHARLKGWKSDRGRIYIKYGDPDDTSSEVHPIDSPPNIVWNYYRINKSFIFYDLKGYGQYQLMNRETEYED